MVDSKVDCEPAFTSNKLACDKPISKSKICPPFSECSTAFLQFLKVIINYNLRTSISCNVPNSLNVRDINDAATVMERASPNVTFAIAGMDRPEKNGKNIK